MAIIRSCYGCVAPKRYPGCHDKCPEYQAEKAEYDEWKSQQDKARHTRQGIISQYNDGVYRAMKHRRKGL